MEVVKLEAIHVEWLLKQKSTQGFGTFWTEAHTKRLEKDRYAYTGIEGDRILFCAGVVEYWPERGEAWAIFGQNQRKDFLKIHNAVKRFLNICPLKRIEATVDFDFEAGHRWVELLGFKLEAERMRSYRMDGGDASLYARVQ